MPKNFRPLVFILLLFAVLTFLVGFRFGKQIERMDKSYVPPVKITPTPPTSPTPPPIKLATYANPDCGLTFLYPADFEEETISSSEARLKDGGQNIFISCDKKTISKFATEVAKLKPTMKTVNNKKIALYEKEKGAKQWSIFNNLTAKTIIFGVSDNLVNLVLKTVEFVK